MNNLSYEFEEIGNGFLKVTLGGKLVTFTQATPINEAIRETDKLLLSNGFSNRKEFYETLLAKDKERLKERQQVDLKKREAIDFEMMKRTLQEIELGNEPAASRKAAIALQSVYSGGTGR